MGLRERQKNQRRKAILDAACALFVRDGFDATKTEAIADAAELSLGTLYNYFDSKGEVLLTLLTHENELVFEHIASMALPFDRGPAAVFKAVFSTYFDTDLMILNRDLWRTGFALSFSDVKSKGARAVRDIDRRLSAQVVDVAEQLKARGAIRADVECTAFAEALFNNANMLFFEYSRSERMTMENLRTRLNAMTDAIVRLAEPAEGAR